MKVVKENLEYCAAPYGHIATIPKGTKVIPASNLPDKERYWAEPWEDMTEKAKGWLAYGFLLEEDDVIDME